MKIGSISSTPSNQTILPPTTPHSSRINNSQLSFEKIQKLKPISQVDELKKVATRNVRMLKRHTNSNLQAFCWLLLQEICCCEAKEDILLILRSVAGNPWLQRLQVEGRDGSAAFNLSQGQVWRCLEGLVEEIRGSIGQNKVELALNKNPICVEAMIVALRRILVSLGIPNARDFQAQVPTVQAYRALLNYFDLAFKNQQSLFLIYQDQLFLLQTQHQHILFGSYYSTPQLAYQPSSTDSQNMTPHSRFNLHQGQSLGHRLSCSLIRESLISEVDADTPSFNFDESQTSFSSSLVSQPNMKRSKEINIPAGTEIPESLLKNNDLKISKMKESLGIFGANTSLDKMTRLENQLIKGFEYSGGFDKILDSVPTANNTPNPLQETPLSFASKLLSPIVDKQFVINRTQSLKVIEKQPKDILFQRHNLPSSKSLRSFKSQQSCLCQQNKQGKNRLYSNLFDISIQCVSEGNQSAPFIRKIKTYVISNGISQQIYQKEPLKTSILRLKNLCPMSKFSGMKPKGHKTVNILNKEKSFEALHSIRTNIDYSWSNRTQQRIGGCPIGVEKSSSKKPYKIPSFLEGRKAEGRRKEPNLISNDQT